MSPAETLRIAVAGIAANKLRSGLTILGMTIGVAAVIVLVAVGNGSKRKVQAGIDALGSNVLIVQAQNGPGGPGGLRFGGGGGGLTLTTADATALQDAFNAPDVKTAAPGGQRDGDDARRRIDELPAVLARGLDARVRHDARLPGGGRRGLHRPGRQEAPAGGDPRPDRRLEPVRRPGSRSASRSASTAPASRSWA